MGAPDLLALVTDWARLVTHFLRLQTFFWSIPAPGSVRSNSQFFLLKSCVCMLSRFLLSLILCNPMDCSPSGSSDHGVLEWVAMPSPRDLPCPGIKPESLRSFALAGGVFKATTTWEAHWRTASRQSLCSGLLALAHFLYLGIIGSLPSSPLHTGPAGQHYHLCHSVFIPAKTPPPFTSIHTTGPAQMPAESWCGQGLCVNSSFASFPAPSLFCTDQLFP